MKDKVVEEFIKSILRREYEDCKSGERINPVEMLRELEAMQP